MNENTPAEQNRPNFNKQAAQDYLSALDPTAKQFTFQTFDDNKERENPKLARVFHGTLDDHFNNLANLSSKGAGVFVNINETDLKGRKIDNIVRIRAVWQEDDDGWTKELPLAPHIIVESSPGKHHRITLIKDGPVRDNGHTNFLGFEGVMSCLINRHGSDSNAKDLARVLRLPGFPHLKDPNNPQQVKLLKIGKHPHYTWDEVKIAYPPPELKRRKNKNSGDTWLPELETEAGNKTKGSGRNSFLYDAGVKAVGYGTPPLLISCLLYHFNSLFIDCLSAKELDTIIGSVLKSDAANAYEPPDWKANDTEGLIAHLNNTYFTVLNGGKFAIGKRPENEFSGSMVDFMNPAAFQGHLRNKKIKIGKNETTWATAWLNHTARMTFSRVVFEPQGNVPDYCYNMYRPPLISDKPPENKHQIFLEHLRDNICNGNMDAYEYIIKWAALMVQKPWVKPEVALVLISENSTGKGALVSWLAGLVHPTHYFHAQNSEHVVGRFNKHLGNAILLYADEAVFIDGKSMDALKAMVTEQHMMMEIKYLDVVQMKSNLHMIMTSNRDHAIRTLEGDRRWMILNVANHRKGDTKYFGEMAKLRKNGGIDSLWHYLNEMDLAGWDHRTPPRTDALIEQETLSYSDLRIFVNNIIENDGHVITKYKGMISQTSVIGIPTAELMEIYENRKNKRDRTRYALNNFVKNIQKYTHCKTKQKKLGGKNIKVISALHKWDETNTDPDQINRGE